MTRLRLTAPEVVPRDQPNSSSSGSSRAPVEDRNPAAATRAAIVAAGDPPGADAGAHVGLRRFRSPAESRDAGQPCRAGAALPDSVGILPAMLLPGRDPRPSVQCMDGSGPAGPPQGHRDLALVPVALVSFVLHARGLLRRARRPRQAACTCSPPPVRAPTGPPLEKLAADLRRLRPAGPVASPGDTTMARQQGIVAAYDEVLVATAAALGGPDHARGPARGPRPRGRAVPPRARARGGRVVAGRRSRSEPAAVRPTPSRSRRRRTSDESARPRRPGCTVAMIPRMRPTFTMSGVRPADRRDASISRSALLPIDHANGPSSRHTTSPRMPEDQDRGRLRVVRCGGAAAGARTGTGSTGGKPVRSGR